MSTREVMSPCRNRATRSRATRNRGLRITCAVPLMAALASIVPVPVVSAQARTPTQADLVADSETERYLRALQVAGDLDWYPWSIRGFSAREVERMVQRETPATPWRLNWSALAAPVSFDGVSLRAAYNSAFPYGHNDGAIWAGRGLTVSGTGGVALRMGPLSALAAPVAFVTQNASFDLLTNGQTGRLSFADGVHPTVVDRPQRFGDAAYGRVDPGASGIRFDSRAVTAGAGTFPMWWGPATEHPFTLGTNAPGIPHVFLGTGRPVNVGIGQLHTRITWGYLRQSEYSPVSGAQRYTSVDSPGTDRLMGGMVLIFAPRPLKGLELGFVRFAHVPFRESGVAGDFLRSPFPTFFKKRLFENAADSAFVEDLNELGSLFARWVFPRAGFEIYGEHGHDDWYHDLRDAVQEPEHNRSYMVGFQKAFRRRVNLSVLRGEVMNYEMPPLARDRPGQGGIYTHFALRQGHTHMGQLLGSPAGVGGAAGSVLAFDRYTPGGRTTLAWRRIVRAQRGSFHETGVEDPRGTDVIHALQLERARHVRALRLITGVEVMRAFNRNFEGDAFNLSANIGLEWMPR